VNVARFLSIIPLLSTWFALQSIALAQLGGVPWTSGGHITTGGSYDIESGQITREVVDFEVPGSVGTHPLRCARTLSTHAEKTDLTTPIVAWHFEHYYVATDLLPVQVSYPSGRLVVFEDSPQKGVFTQRGVPDRFEVVNGVRRLLLSDGTIVEFSPLRAKGVHDHAFVGTKITDPHGLVTTVEPYNLSWPRRISDQSGRWINFEFDEQDQLRAATSSAGQRVTYELQDQIGNGAGPMISTAHYDDGSSATYRYSGLRESCSANLPLELRDVRANSKIQHIRYDWVRNGVTTKCELGSELSASGAVVSTRQAPPRSVPPLFFEVLPSGRRRSYIIDFSFLQERTDAFDKLWKYQYDKRGFLSGVTDPYTRTTHIVNEPEAGKIISIRYPDNTNPDKPSLSYTYTDPKRPYFTRTKTDERGHTTTYYYHPFPRNGVVQRIEYPDRTWESWDELTPFAQPRVHTLRTGAKEYFEYDDMGRLVTRWNPTFEEDDPRTTPALESKVGRTRYVYYRDGHPWEDLLEAETDPRGNTTRYEYARWPGDSGPIAPLLPTRPGDIAPGTAVSGRPLRTKTTYADGFSVVVAYNQFGQKISERNEEGEETSYEYDDDFNRLTAKRAPLGRTTRYDYTPVSDGIIDVASGPNARHTHTSSVPITTISPEKVRYINAYDEEDRILLKVEAAGTPDAAATRFEYDDVKRLIRKIDPELRETTFGYDNRDRKTSEVRPGNRKTEWSYDDSGNVETITYFLNDPEAGDQPYTEVESFKYDGMNNRTEHTDERGATTTYKFEGGMLSRILDHEGRQSGYNYDASGRVSAKITPSSALGSMRFQESFVYDLAGNLEKHADNRRVTESIQYDARNREQLRTYSDGTPSRATPLYDGVGRPRIQRTIAADPRDSTLIEYDYDDAGRVEASRQKVGDHRAREIRYLYNFDDQVRAVFPGNNSDLEKTYTKRGQLEYVIDELGDVAKFSYYADGQLREKELYNETLSVHRYDTAGRLEIIEDNKGAGRRYRYDDRDRLRETTTERGITESFDYFPDSQLLSYRRTGTSRGASQDDTFTYDDSGNRLSSSLHGEYALDGTNQYRSVTGPASEQFGYDAVGNLTSRKGWAYTYDAKWRMIGARAADSEAGFTFTYDAEGRLVGIRDPKGAGKHALYDGNNAIAWFDDDDDDRMVEATVWGRGDDEPIVTWSVENREALVYHLDRQHNVVQLSDYNGKALEGFVYGAFGAPEVLPALQPFASIGKTSPPYLYTSQRWLPDLSLYHYRARAYDPNLGRFLQTDPAGIDAGDLNLYRYVHNSPTQYNDPSGNVPVAIPVIWWIAAEAAPYVIAVAAAALTVNAGPDIKEGLAATATAIQKGVDAAADAIHKVGTNNDAVSTAQHSAHKATEVDKPAKEVNVSESKYPESAGHIKDAQESGKPSTLTIDRSGANARRSEAMKGNKPQAGKDRDEYPPAMFKEGGAGSSVRRINPGDNRGAGACIGAQCRGLPDGTQVDIKVVP
jgi:RHS repeat-associated protein